MNKTQKNCLIYNYAQHYRYGIFSLMDDNNYCDFYFGDKYRGIKKIDYKLLKNFKKELSNINLYSGIYWQKGALSLLFKNYNQYIILGEYLCLSTWLILLLSKLFNKKVYFWSHGWYGNESFIKRIVKRLFFNLSNGVFLYGNYAKKLMIQEGINPQKLHVIYNSLDYKKQLKVRDKLFQNDIFIKKFNNDYPVLIFIGRLTVVKKIHYLILLLEKLRKKNIFTNLVIVGDGEERNKIKEYAKKNNVQDFCWFYGKSYNEDEIGNLIFNSDLCVSPGNVGLTAMHSLVYGTPIITHSDFKNQVPEFEAIEQNLSGNFFQKDNIDDLTSVVESWLKNMKNRDIIRQNCFNIIDKYYNPKYQFKIIKKVTKI